MAICLYLVFSLRWCHNGCDGVSNHQRHDCLPFIRAQIKANIKAPRHWPLCREFTGDRWIPYTNGQQRGKSFHFMASSCKHWQQSKLLFLLSSKGSIATYNRLRWHNGFESGIGCSKYAFARAQISRKGPTLFIQNIFPIICPYLLIRFECNKKNLQLYSCIGANNCGSWYMPGIFIYLSSWKANLRQRSISGSALLHNLDILISQSPKAVCGHPKLSTMHHHYHVDLLSFCPNGTNFYENWINTYNLFLETM